MEKILFLDRDGVILKEPAEDYQIDSLEKLEFVPGIISGLFEIIKNGDFGRIVLVSNQDGLGTDSFPEERFLPPHEKMIRTLAGEGIHFDDILIDRSFPDENSDLRKPGTGLVKKYLEGEFNISNSIMIGDRLTDMEFAKRIGCKGIWFAEKQNAHEFLPDLKNVVVCVSDDWEVVSGFVLSFSRMISIERNTRETAISLSLNPDGTGAAEIDTGLRFFDHMLEQLACHSGIDISLKCRGDLDVDEHHTIEDTGLVLGDGIRKALGGKKGLNRYGFLLPMDDALARVAMDLGGRPWLSWDCGFNAEKIGDVPVGMFEHFFRSFSVSAGCTLHISATGTDDHHKIESVFKGVARALRDAVGRCKCGCGIPSTKGRI